MTFAKVVSPDLAYNDRVEGAAMVNPPPSVPSLQEQQLRFVAAQTLMAVPRMRRQSPSGRGGGHSTEPFPEAAEATRKRSRRQVGKMTADIRSKESGCEPASGPAPRKTAYKLQKEQRSDLEDQVRKLEERVERLRLRMELPTKADKQKITEARDHNAALDEKIHSGRQRVVRLQSMVMQELQLPTFNSLSTFIHLPCDQAQRRAILHGMKDVKLRRAAAVSIEHFRHLENNGSCMSEERFMAEDGTFHCNRNEMNAFPNFTSARQLYDALLFWVYNMEISVTEMLNQIALREDGGDIEPTIWNHRFVVQTEDVGCTEELNLVGFAQFYNSYDLVGGGPLGVIAFDTVNHDELYPYKPLERTRKDVQAAHLVCEVLDPETQRRLPVVKSYGLNAQLAPEFPVEQRVVDKLHEQMSRWNVVMVQYLRDYAVPVDCSA